VFTDIIWIGFNISAIVISYQVIQNMLKFVGRTAVLKIPMHYVFATIPFGFFLMTLRLIQNYFQKPMKEK
jgi:TRAP-type C4-dicarboxylate transport system permease small subunit